MLLVRLHTELRTSITKIRYSKMAEGNMILFYKDIFKTYKAFSVMKLFMLYFLIAKIKRGVGPNISKFRKIPQ